MTPFLSLLTWAPALFGLVLLTLLSDRGSARGVAVMGAVLSTLLVIPVLWQFDFTQAGFQLVEQASLFGAVDVSYRIGVDGLSMPLVVLSVLIFLLSVIFLAARDTAPMFFAALFFQQSFVLGAFLALDAILFYFFFEAILMPMFLLIGIWGGKNRIFASYKFFLVTFFASIFLLVALLVLGHAAGSFSVPGIYQHELGLLPQGLLFAAMMFAFAVKLPMWPVHTWLPDAHVEAPTVGSVILAAILLKLGGYGIIRYVVPALPDASLAFAWVMIVLGLAAIVYVGVVAFSQSDVKKLVAYSSVSHMGFVTVGIFAAVLLWGQQPELSNWAFGGAVMQMVSHGLISAALFFLIGVIYEQAHTRDISAFGGLAAVIPAFSFFLVLFAMANVGMPGTSGFVGEFMVVVGAFGVSLWVSALAALVLVTGAIYSLWMVRKVVFGVPAQSELVYRDLGGADRLVFAVLALLVVFLGWLPGVVLNLAFDYWAGVGTGFL